MFSLVKNLIKKYKQATPKQLVLTGVFMLAIAGAIGAGFAARSASMAATLRDCDDNAILRCGAADVHEFVADARANVDGRNGDLQAIYAHFGLSPSEYDTFVQQAKPGTFYRDGRIVVEGVTVATNAHSMGRQNYRSSHPYQIGNTTYYYGTPSQRWSSGTSSLPVWVWFDGNGAVKFAVITACGNPIPHMEKKIPHASCDNLQKHEVSGKKNTYQFSAQASKNEMVDFLKFNYYYNDGSGYKLFDSKTNPSDKTKEMTFTKNTKVKVEIEIRLFGIPQRIITSPACVKEIEVKQFYHVCESLVATSADNKTFRFTLKTRHSEGVTVKNADFKLDDKTTTTVSPVNGDIYRDYTFTDYEEHIVRISKIVFTVDGEDKSITPSEEQCFQKVKRDKPPVCPYNPNLPPNHPNCKKVETCEENPGKEGCELPSTGPAGVAGLFAGVTAAGAIGHRLYMSRKARRSE